MSDKAKSIIYLSVAIALGLTTFALLSNLENSQRIPEYILIPMLGAFVFTVLYFWVSSKNKQIKAKEENSFDRENHLFSGIRNRNAILDIMMHLMNIDGVISEYEDKRFQAFLKANFPLDITKTIFQVYEKRKLKHHKTLGKKVQFLKKQLSYRTKLQFIDLLIRTATYDKLLSNKEREFILDTARRLGIPARTVLIILDRHDFIEEKDIGNKHQNKKEVLSSESFLLKQLDLDDNVGNLAIKKRYRELVKIYHPDKLLEASEQEKLEAEMKFLDIQEAYDKLQALRKM